jgi:hypothetical protein
MSWSVVLSVAGVWIVAGLIVAVVLGAMFRRMDDAEEHEADVDRHRADVKYMRGKKKQIAAKSDLGTAGCPVASQMAGQIGRRRTI